MRNVILTLAGIFMLPVLWAQELEEVFWQSKTDLIAAGYIEGYYFDGDKFQFSKSQFEQLNPLTKIGGRYKILGDSIIFRVEYFKWADFEIIETEWPPHADWSIMTRFTGAEDFTFYRFEKPYLVKAPFARTDTTFTIGNHIYYKLPHEYKKVVLPDVDSKWPVFKGFE